MNDLEWSMLSFILCDSLWKVQKSHEVNREGSFKLCPLAVLYKTLLIAFLYFKFEYDHYVLQMLKIGCMVYILSNILEWHFQEFTNVKYKIVNDSFLFTHHVNSQKATCELLGELMFLSWASGRSSISIGEE